MVPVVHWRGHADALVTKRQISGEKGDRFAVVCRHFNIKQQHNRLNIADNV